MPTSQQEIIKITLTMKKVYLIIMIGMTAIFNAYSQDQDTIPGLIEEKSANGYMLRDADLYTKVKRSHKPKKEDPEFTYINIDTALVYPGIREIISRKYYNDLNKTPWYIVCRVNNYGEIISLYFFFKNLDGVNRQEFAILSDWLKKEVRWDLKFNKEVKDTIYFIQSFPGPKF
jgi:hypothetical protein